MALCQAVLNKFSINVSPSALQACISYIESKVNINKVVIRLVLVAYSNVRNFTHCGCVKIHFFCLILFPVTMFGRSLWHGNVKTCRKSFNSFMIRKNDRE